MSDTPTEKLLPRGLQDMLSAHRKYTAQANDINNEIIDREMKTLHLSLKAKWYEMIESGVKTEEYREIKPYWCKRIVGENTISVSGVLMEKYEYLFTHVKFSYGYTKRTMTFEIESITIGKGNPEWGAPTEDVFIIKLGKRV